MPENEEMITGVTSPAANSDVPQFATAEYAHIPGTERCRICGNLVSGEYFRVNNLMACSKCAGEAQAGQPTDSHAAFARALFFGIGASILGFALYSGIAIVAGFTIGYFALGVGWLVAKGMMKGSNGIGGRRYQIVAVLLTYVAIAFAEIPIGLAYAFKHRPAQTQHSATSSESSPGAQSNPNGAGNSSAADSAAPAQASPSRPRPNLGKAIVTLAFVGFAAPFLELQNPAHGLIGLVILFVGLSISFRMTAAKPLAVEGPYSVTG